MHSAAKKTQTEQVSRSAANVVRNKTGMSSKESAVSRGSSFVQPLSVAQPMNHDHQTVVQPKLHIASPNDQKEKEADDMAGRVAGLNGSGDREVTSESGADTIRRDSSSPAKGTPVSNGFSRALYDTKGKGSPMDQGVQAEMQSSFGSDFSGVSIHTGSYAAEMSKSIQARAFTHGNDIYFNEGEYRPETEQGKYLLAHELTHTIQQNGSGEDQEGTIQRSRLGRAWRGVKRTVSRAGEWVGDRLEAGKEWLLGKLKGMVEDLPGYKLFTVVIGRDPITKQNVDRNGRNFIEAGLDVIPNGEEYKRKLEEEGALGEAAAWLDDQLDLLDISPSDILNSFSTLWNSLSIADVRRPQWVFNRILDLFTAPVLRIIRFARNIVFKFLEIIKNYMISKVRDFIIREESPSFYPLLTVILGKDPVTGEEVERNGENILRGFIMLHPEGDDQLARLEETGTFQRAAEWVDQAILRIQSIASGLREAFLNLWNAITDIQSLLNPVATFWSIYEKFSGPLRDLMDFAIEVALSILRFIRDALMRRFSAWAQDTRGYPLITLLLRKDPFTEEPVPATPRNVIRGFIALLPNGLERFEQLEESGAIDRMLNWISGAVADLNMTWEYIKGLFWSLWESFTVSDLANPLQLFRDVINTFADPVRRLISFVSEVLKAMIMFALEIMNFPVDMVRGIVNNAMQAIGDIRRDPVGFLLNLLRAVRQGFSQFFDNFVQHLTNGLQQWLFGELASAGIQPPADLSLRSVLGLVMNVLGITADNIMKRLENKIGKERVDRIREMIDRVSGAWSFIKEVYERGPVAIWEYVQEKLGNLWSIISGYIRNWIVTQIIQRVTARLLTMLDPTGIMAVVNGFISFFRAIQSFFERLRDMLAIVYSFTAGVAQIARGSIGQAASFLEQGLAQGIPVAIGFLANQVHLRNLGTRVAEMIEDVQERVNNAIDWLIDRALQAGSSIMEMGRSAVDTISDWLGLREEFRLADNQKHEIYFRNEDPEAPVMIASADPMTLEQILQSKKWNDKDIPEEKVAELRRLANEIDQNRDSQGVAKGREIKKCFIEIAGILKTVGGVPLPETYVETKTSFGSGTAEIGKEVNVLPLSLHPGSLAGSQPTIESDMGRDLKDMYPSYFVEGHLLNHKMHGPGNERWNMTPITQKTNGDMNREVESDSKQQLLSTGNVLQYHVTVNYPSDTLDINKPTYPHQQIAESLTMIVRQLKYDTNNNEWVEDDSVRETNKTITHNTSTVPGFGTGSLNHDVDLLSADKDALQRIPGIGPERADAIVKYRKNQEENGHPNPFTNKSNLSQVRGIGDRLTEIIKRNPKVKPHP